MKTKKVVIIGAGIGGLCTAIALQQQDFEVTIYEKVNAPSEVGAGLTLWSNALKALRTLGVADQVIGAGSKLTRSQLRASNGNMLYNAHTDEMEREFGEPVVAIHRAVLHEILINALHSNTLKLGMKFARLSQDNEKVSIDFENGACDLADILVGADGIHSGVRKQLFPSVQMRYSGYTAWRSIVETENEAALGLSSESWGMGARFGIVRVDQKRVYWFATHNQPSGERASGEQRKSKLLRLFDDWHDPIRHLLDATPGDLILQNDIYDIPPLPEWTAGRVTLLGDAVHPTTPNLGQGACMAIESAFVLGRALKDESDYQSAFERYERERHARTAWVTNQSWTIGKSGQLDHPWLCKLRDFSVRLIPTGALQTGIRRAAGFDVTKDKGRKTNAAL